LDTSVTKMSFSRPLFEYLKDVPIEKIMKEKKPILSLQSTQTVADAIKFLATNRIISAPIVDPLTNECFSIVDMTDIVHFIQFVAPDLTSLKENELRSLVVSGRALACGKLKEVADLSGKNPFITIHYQSKAEELLKHFSKGIRRIPIVDDQKNIINIISQFDVIRFLKNLNEQGQFPEFFQQEIGKICSEDFKIVSSQETVLKIIQIILDSYPITAVAPVDQEGALVGNFSASDFRGLFREQLPSFLLPVKDFLKKHSPSSLTPVKTKKVMTIGEVLKELVSNHVHQMWIVDKDSHPIGIISLTCIISSITRECVVS